MLFIQVLTEADKRKAGELRAQHDAHVLQLQQLERQARAQTAQLVSRVIYSIDISLYNFDKT